MRSKVTLIGSKYKQLKQSTTAVSILVMVGPEISAAGPVDTDQVLVYTKIP